MTSRVLLLGLAWLSAGGVAPADDAPSAQVAQAMKLLSNPRAADATRIKAAAVLAEQSAKGLAAESALCSGMLSTSPKVRAACSEALETVRPEIQPHVMTLVTDRDETAHFEALHALAKLGSGAVATAPLIAAHIRTTAAVSVSMPNMNPRLFNTNPDSPLVVTYVDELGSMQRSAISSLIRSGSSSSGAGPVNQYKCTLLACAGAVALARVAGGDAELAYKSYMPLLKHPNNLIRFGALAALSLHGKKAEKCLPAVNNLKTDPSREVRQLAVRVAADIRTGSAGRALGAKP